MQAQPPPLGAATSLVEPTELNTDSCFSTALLAHLGQLTFSRLERTMVSNGWSHWRQRYSKIGISPRFAPNYKCQIADSKLSIRFWNMEFIIWNLAIPMG